jgi:hypothetical protein
MNHPSNSPERTTIMTKNTAPAIVLSTDDKAAMALVTTIKSSVNGQGKYSAYVTSHSVTRETVKDHALALAVLAYPKDAPVQKTDGKRTRFGNAVQAAGNGLRAALGPAENKASDPLTRILKAVEAGQKAGLTSEAIAEALAGMGITLPAGSAALAA